VEVVLEGANWVQAEGARWQVVLGEAAPGGVELEGRVAGSVVPREAVLDVLPAKGALKEVLPEAVALMEGLLEGAAAKGVLPEETTLMEVVLSKAA